MRSLNLTCQTAVVKGESKGVFQGYQNELTSCHFTGWSNEYAIVEH